MASGLRRFNCATRVMPMLMRSAAMLGPMLGICSSADFSRLVRLTNSAALARVEMRIFNDADHVAEGIDHRRDANAFAIRQQSQFVPTDLETDVKRMVKVGRLADDFGVPPGRFGEIVDVVDDGA